MKLLILGVSMLLCLNVSSQEGTLRLHGRMESNGKMIPGVSIEVIKDNQIIYEGKTDEKGNYKLDLELGSVYNIAFIKDGYVTKQVGVIAIHPEAELTKNYAFQLDLELFEEDSDTPDDTMLPPVAKLYIKDVNKGFTYDKKYVKWVATEFQGVQSND